MNAIRTTVSLPTRIIDKLEKQAHGHRGVQYLAKLCLVRAIHKLNLEHWCPKSTAQYNLEACNETLDIYFYTEEFRTLKTIRITQSISVSFLLALSVDEFLSKIVSILNLRHGNFKSKQRFNFWWGWVHSVYSKSSFTIKSNKLCTVKKIGIVIRQPRLEMRVIRDIFYSPPDD